MTCDYLVFDIISRLFVWKHFDLFLCISLYIMEVIYAMNILNRVNFRINHNSHFWFMVLVTPFATTAVFLSTWHRWSRWQEKTAIIGAYIVNVVVIVYTFYALMAV